MRALCLLIAILFAAGCTRAAAPAKRGPLSGTVTLNGQLVARGRIRLLAIDPGGINVAAEILQGKFGLSAEQGPTKGRYRVEFSVPSAAKVRTPDYDNPGKFIEESAESLPPRYHRDSTIAQDYDPDNPMPLSFKLTTP